ncbi:MAG: DUF29 domain-containing protein [Alphaproteobacteria bacterium]|nr:DUF29 domain-containing protein [Alphaproteobacteria bacterium]
MNKSNLYERDFFAWANEQAALLRAGNLSAADIGHIAEEIESMGRTEKRELVSRLTVLLSHLLEWRYQPSRRGASWYASITNTRRDLADHLDDNPSLKAMLGAAIAKAYGRAILEAAAETGLDRETFPATCPWGFERVMGETFWPSGDDDR